MPLPRSRISPGALVTLGLVALSAFILRDTLFFGEAFFERDLAWLYYPQVEAFVRAISEGAWPLRDPTIGFGQPLLGSPDTQILYPLGWLHLILLPEQAYSLLVLAHFLIGALGASALGRHFSGSRWTGFFAGAFWIASGPFQSAVNLWHHFAGTAWVPWVLLAFERLLEKPDARRMLTLGAVFGAQILAGSADLCVMTVLLALLRLLCEAGSLRTVAAAWLPRRAFMIAAAAAIAVSLGAGVWLPALEIVRTSGRSALPRESRTEWSVHPLVATEIVFPSQFGALPLSEEARRLLTDGRPPFLKSLFLGSLVVPLVVAGLLNRAVSLRIRTFLGVGAIISLLAALGRFSPVYDILVTLLPPLSIFRFPIKVTLALSLLMSLLAALGVRTLVGVERLVVSGLCVLMLMGNAWIYFGLSGLFVPLLDPVAPAAGAVALARVGAGLAWGALPLMALGLATVLARPLLIHLSVLMGVGVTLFVNGETNFTIPREVMRFRPDHVALFDDREPTRLYAFPYLHYPERLPEVLSPRSPIPPESFIVLIRSALMAPIGGVWKLEYGWDYDQKGLHDLTLSGLSRYLNRPERPPSFLRLLQVANVARVVDFHSLDDLGLELEHTVPIVGVRPLYVHRVPGALPRAFAVSGVRPSSLAQAQSALLNPRFEPRQEVAIEGVIAAPISPTFASTVKIRERRSDRIVIDAELNEPGYVVLLEGFLPGWRATVNGEAAPVRRANALFVAVKAPAGRHEVTFTYRPSSAVLGIAVSLLTALALLLAAVFVRSRSAGP